MYGFGCPCLQLQVLKIDSKTAAWAVRAAVADDNLFTFDQVPQVVKQYARAHFVELKYTNIKD